MTKSKLSKTERQDLEWSYKRRCGYLFVMREKLREAREEYERAADNHAVANISRLGSSDDLYAAGYSEKQIDKLGKKILERV